jgi:hypothetical protein
MKGFSAGNLLPLLAAAAWLLPSMSSAFTARSPVSVVVPRGMSLSASPTHLRQGFRMPLNGVKKSLAKLSMSENVASTPEEPAKGFLGKLKSIVPPANERKKLFPLALMFFCILFNYTILRDTKDVLMITAPKSGAEVIPFIKTYFNLPVAIVRIYASNLLLVTVANPHLEESSAIFNGCNRKRSLTLTLHFSKNAALSRRALRVCTPR